MSAMPLRVLDHSDLDAWDRWLPGARGSNLRQVSLYRRALDAYGYRSRVVVLEREGRWIAGGLVGLKAVPLTPVRVAHVSGGIALAPEAGAEDLVAFLRGLESWCRKRGAALLEISLRIPRIDTGMPSLDGATVHGRLESAGYRPTERLATYLVDLGAESDDALLERFGANPRRHVRKAAREGLLVEPTRSPADFEAFEAVHAEMCSRKGLTPLPARFGEQVLRPAVERGEADLFVARFRGVPRNYLLVGVLEVPLYHWGAVAEAAREPGCPQTGQALHFAAMCHYRSRGFAVYDFGGAPGPEPESDHPNFSVWKFKREFNGRYVEFAGHWEKTLSALGAGLLHAARRVSEARRRRRTP